MREYRIIKDESGMTMALAVIMVALFSVMGAGLLVFATSDLNTVVESNQGQRAFEMADAGVEAAKRQLANDSTASKYDGGSDDHQWSRCYDKLPAACASNPSVGVSLSNLYPSATVNEVTVTIQSQDSPEGSFKVISTGEYGNAKRIIEAVLQPTSRVKLRPEYYTGSDFICDGNGQFSGDKLSFIVEDDATWSSNCDITMNSGNIFVGGSTPDGGVTADFNSNTKLSNGSIYVNGSANFDSNVDIGGGDGIYVRDNATFNSNTGFASNGRVYIGGNAAWDSNAVVSNSSIYAKGNVSFDSNSGLENTSLFSRSTVNLKSSNFKHTGQDNIYEKWKNSFNPFAERETTASGIGTMGTITGSGASESKRGTQSFDSTTTKKFIGTGATSHTQMNFPFDITSYTQPLADATASASESRLTIDDINALREIAKEQEAATGRDHYREVSNGTREIESSGSDQWPISSSNVYGYGTVVFYSFSSDSNSNKVVWNINAGCDNVDRRGILVVENGNFETSSNNSGFNGWVIVPNGSFKTDSNTCMHAYIYAQEGLTARSNTEIFDLPASAQQDLNAFRRVKVLAWRECYNTACN